MKLKFYSFYSKMISLCLIALGFNSCSDNGNDDFVVEYGSPTASYKVSGKVVSEEENKEPIKNIRVVMVPDIDESKYPVLRGDTVFTNNDGNFELKNAMPMSSVKYKVKFQDVDGEANGLFEDKQQIIEFKSSDFVGGEGWYKGEAQKDMGTIELTPKETQE